MRFSRPILTVVVVVLVAHRSGSWTNAVSASGGGGGPAAYGHGSYAQGQQGWQEESPSYSQVGAPPSSDEQQQQLPPLPEGWSEHIDPGSGQPYYFNAADGTTTWDRPMLPDSLSSVEEEEEESAEASSAPPQEDARIDIETPDEPSDQRQQVQQQQPYGDRKSESVSSVTMPNIRRTEDAVHEEERWRASQGWHEKSAQEREGVEPGQQERPSSWGVTNQAAAPQDQTPMGWDWKESTASDQAPGATSPENDTSQQQQQQQRETGFTQQAVMQDRRPCDSGMQGSSDNSEGRPSPLEQGMQGHVQQPIRQREEQQPGDVQQRGRKLQQDPRSASPSEPAKEEGWNDGPERRSPWGSGQGQYQPPPEARGEAMQQQQPPQRFAPQQARPQQQQHWSNAPNTTQGRPPSDAQQPAQAFQRRGPPSHERDQGPLHDSAQNRPQQSSHEQQRQATPPTQQGGPQGQAPPQQPMQGYPERNLSPGTPGQYYAGQQQQQPPPSSQQAYNRYGNYSPQGQQAGQYGQRDQYGQYGQYGQQQPRQYGSYPQYGQQQAGQLATQETSSAVREALGSAWQGILGFGNRTKEAVENARNTVVSKTQEATQTISSRSTSKSHLVPGAFVRHG